MVFLFITGIKRMPIYIFLAISIAIHLLGFGYDTGNDKFSAHAQEGSIGSNIPETPSIPSAQTIHTTESLQLHPA